MSSYAALDLNASDGPVKPIEEEQARSSRLRATVALLAVVAVSLLISTSVLGVRLADQTCKETSPSVSQVGARYGPIEKLVHFTIPPHGSSGTSGHEGTLEAGDGTTCTSLHASENSPITARCETKADGLTVTTTAEVSINHVNITILFNNSVWRKHIGGCAVSSDGTLDLMHCGTVALYPKPAAAPAPVTKSKALIVHKDFDGVNESDKHPENAVGCVLAAAGCAATCVVTGEVTLGASCIWCLSLASASCCNSIHRCCSFMHWC
mmetsp:Transcript_22024/g.47428  ORF Transcript_22024/g.47428 Transcript_22024/m.47428 type:complete len:266 (-) Transcript_22024:74-871(-)